MNFFKKIKATKLMFMFSLASIISTVSCGANYVINKNNLDKSNISQKEFYDRLKEIKEGKRKSLSITFINMKNESKKFVINKQNYLSVEDRIKEFIKIGW